MEAIHGNFRKSSMLIPQPNEHHPLITKKQWASNSEAHCIAYKLRVLPEPGPDTGQFSPKYHSTNSFQ